MGEGGGLFTIDNLYRAYRACRRNKRGAINTLRFEAGLLDNLCSLREELAGGVYRPTTSICFVQRRPKLREIFAADFRDRVVHHLLVGYLEPLFEPLFIHDSYACRRERGVHAAVTRLQAFLHKVTINGTARAWYLKEDISGFFMNIDKNILYELVCRRTRQKDLQWLAGVLIFHDCTEDYHFKGNPLLLDRIPPHKTLFRVPAGKGLPIGNLTSQFFANVYLNELDQFVKRRLGCRYYLRYCDDFVLLDRSAEKLLQWRDQIEEFLHERLLLQLNHSQHRLRPVADGINFLGYIVRRRYVLVRKRVVSHLRERLERYDALLAERRPIPRSRQAEQPGATGAAAGSGVAAAAGKRPMRVAAWRYPEAAAASLRSVLASYLGHFQWADSHRLVESLWKRYPVVEALFLLDEGRLLPRYLPPRPRTRKRGRGHKPVTLRGAYRYWAPPARRAVDAPDKKVLRPLWVRQGEPQRVLIFFQVGRFYEFYDAQAEEMHKLFGLKLMTGLRGFCRGCGFHRRWLGRYLRGALRSGYFVALVRSRRRVDGTVERRVRKLFTPLR